MMTLRVQDRYVEYYTVSGTFDLFEVGRSIMCAGYALCERTYQLHGQI
jgi:hypothetical protein